MAYDEERQVHLDYKYRDDPREQPKNKTWCRCCKFWVWDSEVNEETEICFSCEKESEDENG